jgi:hypothetical protein
MLKFSQRDQNFGKIVIEPDFDKKSGFKIEKNNLEYFYMPFKLDRIEGINLNEDIKNDVIEAFHDWKAKGRRKTYQEFKGGPFITDIDDEYIDVYVGEREIEATKNLLNEIGIIAKEFLYKNDGIFEIIFSIK